MGPGAPLFFWGGLPPTFEFCLINLSNTVSIGSIVKVNRLMKKFCRILSVLFVIWQDFVNVWQNTPRTIWSPFSGLLTTLVLSNSVVRLCHFACLCVGTISCHTIKKLL